MHNVEIEIEGAPPSAEQLERWREEAQALASQAESMSKRLMYGFVMITVLVIGGGAVGIATGLPSVTIGSLIAGAILLIGGTAYGLTVIDVRLMQARQAQLGLSDISLSDHPEKYVSWLEWCEEETLLRYQRQMEQSGRSNPIHAEYQAGEAYRRKLELLEKVRASRERFGLAATAISYEKVHRVE